MLKEELGDPDLSIVSIGQAGENLARQATIEQHYRSGTAIGDTMGSKRLKAIAVMGTKGVKVWDPEAIQELNEKYLEFWKERRDLYDRVQREREAAGEDVFRATHRGDDVFAWEEQGDIGVAGNWESNEWRFRKDVDDEIFRTRVDESTFPAVKASCLGCPFSCQVLYSVPGIGMNPLRCYPRYWNWQVWQPDMKVIYEAFRLGSDYGLELWEISHTVSWLMQLYHEGVITAKETDGIPMERGSAEALLQSVHKVANREGFGDILANGSLAFAEKLGPEAEKYLIHKRGMQVRTLEYRNIVTDALGEAISARGNSRRATIYHIIVSEKTETPEELKEAYKWIREWFGHKKALHPFSYEGGTKVMDYYMHHMAIGDMMGFCTGMSFNPQPVRMGVWRRRGLLGVPPLPDHNMAAARFTAATGVPMDVPGLFVVSDRIFNVERAFNVREGITRKEDTIPDFF
jgi:aldehyde:ferredoxin oxidoreductase